MSITLNPYLGFRDSARTALEFYHSVFGGQLTLSTFGEMGASDDPADRDRIMHGAVTVSDGVTLMGSDAPDRMPVSDGSSISISLSGDDEVELRGYWDRLAVGATIIEPLTTAPWGDTFGMLTDAYGTAWLVNIVGPQSDHAGSVDWSGVGLTLGEP